MKIIYTGKRQILDTTLENYRTSTGCTIAISLDKGKHHLSISHHSRMPSKKEIQPNSTLFSC